MTAITPICPLCAHGHFKSAPCPTGDVVDAQARFTIARAAAIAKRRGYVNEGQGLLEAEIELAAAFALPPGYDPVQHCELFDGTPCDMDGRVIEP